MNLRSLDLNLLRVFDAIYSERSISRAALRLHLSQPAVSNALGRLRERLGDALFERTPHGMTPTAHAKTLAGPIRQALLLLERGLRGQEAFDFADARREFVVAVEDYGETVILPRFIDWLAKVAPGVTVRIRPEPAVQLRSELRDGAVDLALDYFSLPEPAFRSRVVVLETLLSLLRRDHPMGGGERLSLDTYLSLRHVILEPRVQSLPMIDLALSKRGLARRIAVTVPHFTSMPVIVQASDMVGTLPHRMALLYADHFRLKTYQLPLRIPRFPIFLIWHESTEADAGHQWFRNHLMEFCGGL
jgi:DNA-binding transcriptional LysR family regulator